MGYSELNSLRSELPFDENGFYELEWRPTEDVLKELVANGINTSGFTTSVEKIKNRLAADPIGNKLAVNEIVQEAEMLVLLQLVTQLPPGKTVSLKEKVYYGSANQGHGIYIKSDRAD